MLLVIESGNSPDLLSGLWGSLASAVVGALVAVLVVFFTNRSQRASADEALREARRSSELALQQQRELLREELQWTKDSSRRSALTKAIASFLSSAQEFNELPGPDFQRGQEISREMERFYVEVLLLGEDAAPLAKVLRKWSSLLVALRLQVIAKTTSDDERAETDDLILLSIRFLHRAMPLWMNGTAAERVDIELAIAAKRKNMMDHLNFDERMLEF